MRNFKFVQALDSRIYSELSQFSKKKGISVQQLIRAIIIPEWMIEQGHSEETSRNRISPWRTPHDSRWDTQRLYAGVSQPKQWTSAIATPDTSNVRYRTGTQREDRRSQ